jgi:hypothetical protein
VRTTAATRGGPKAAAQKRAAARRLSLLLLFLKSRRPRRAGSLRPIAVGPICANTLCRSASLNLNWFARYRDKFRLQEPPTPLMSERHCLYVLNPQFVPPLLYWAHHLP